MFSTSRGVVVPGLGIIDDVTGNVKWRQVLVHVLSHVGGHCCPHTFRHIGAAEICLTHFTSSRVES